MRIYNSFPELAFTNEITSLYNISVIATHHFLSKDDIQFFQNTIQRNKIFEQVNLTAVKNNNNKILGFMGISGDNLEMLFLHPDARNKGIGKTLLKHAVKNFNLQRLMLMNKMKRP